METRLLTSKIISSLCHKCGLYVSEHYECYTICYECITKFAVSESACLPQQSVEKCFKSNCFIFFNFHEASAFELHLTNVRLAVFCRTIACGPLLRAALPAHPGPGAVHATLSHQPRDFINTWHVSIRLPCFSSATTRNLYLANIYVTVKTWSRSKLLLTLKIS